MGIENPTTSTAENSEPKKEQGERYIQDELAAVNTQERLEHIQGEIDSRNEIREEKGKRIREIVNELMENGIIPSLNREAVKEYSAQLSEELDELNESFKKETLDTVALRNERLSIYSSNPELAHSRIVDLELKGLRKLIAEHPNYIDRFPRLNQAPKEGLDYIESKELQDLVDEFRPFSPDGSRPGYEEETVETFKRELEAMPRATRDSEQKTSTAHTESFHERVSPQTAEFMTSHILDKDLAYQDAELPEEHKEQMLQWSRSSESAKKYAESIAEAGNVGGLETVRNMARQMRDTMLSEASRLGIPVSPQGKSFSWAMWDTGKQYHFFTHQNENDAQYEIGNPLESEAKREEIVNRHLGWEAYAAFQNNPEYRGRVSNNAPALAFFNKAPKQNGMLSSKDLAELGKALRAE